MTGFLTHCARVMLGLASTAALTGAAGCVGQRAAAMQPTLDLSDPTQAVEAWVKLKGDSTEAITYEWMRGTVYGIPDDARSDTLFGIESVTIRQFRHRN